MDYSGHIPARHNVRRIGGCCVDGDYGVAGDCGFGIENEPRRHAWGSLELPISGTAALSAVYSFSSNSTINTRVTPSAAFLADIWVGG